MRYSQFDLQKVARQTAAITGRADRENRKLTASETDRVQSLFDLASAHELLNRPRFIGRARARAR